MKTDKKETQMRRVFKSFLTHPKTMLMVSKETKILRSNITWYVAEWRKKGMIFLVRKGKCPISGYSLVGYYTTDKSKVSCSVQLVIFKPPKKHDD